MSFILAIILIAFSLPFIGRLLSRLLGWWVARKLTSQARKAYEETFGSGFYGFGGSEQSDRNNESSTSTPPAHGKRIDPTVGEYIEYEEVEESREINNETQEFSASSTEEYFKEEQIEDAEWEEI